MTAMFDESRMIHGGDTDAQLDEIINSTNDADREQFNKNYL